MEARNIHVRNSLSGEREILTPISQDNVRMFVCGPTVYGPMHIGHAKTYISYDLMARVLRHRYGNLTYIQNITDVDDKIIQRALEENSSAEEVARRWEEAYHRSMAALGNDQVDSYHRAHEHIPQIVRQITTLLERGHAYPIEGDGIYFDSSSLSGQYQGLNPERAFDDGQSRLNNPRKRSQADFALWKFSKPGEAPSWEAPFGNGRPGWHIEDTAISEEYLGSSYDIHGGAIDLIFPHHEAEVMIMKAVSGEDIARYWLHGGLLTVNGKKMGKSLNNFITVDEMLEKWGGRVLRFFVLSKNYSSNVDWTEEALIQAANSLERIENHYRYAHEELEGDGELWDDIIASLYDDFNSSEALAKVFSAQGKKQLSRRVLRQLQEIYNTFDFAGEEVPPQVEQLALRRSQERRGKNWAAADELRLEIQKLGWIVRDEGDGYSLLRDKE